MQSAAALSWDNGCCPFPYSRFSPATRVNSIRNSSPVARRPISRSTIVILETLAPGDIADGPQRRTSDLAGALSDFIRKCKDLVSLFIEQ